MTMDRRAFLATLGATVAGANLSCAGAAAASGRRRLSTVGVQLYSLRTDARQDLERTLASIAEVGYRSVELLGSMNNFDMPAAQLRAVLDRVGLRAPSTHIGGNALNDMDRLLDEAARLGHEYVTVASLPIQGAATVDHYRHWADRLNEAGAVALRRGVRVAFHNHAGDLAPIGGVVPYDVLMERTDPEIVRHQLDTGNTAMAGADPIAYLRKYGARYWMFHIKDVPAMGAKNDTELGKGIIDFRTLLSAIPDIDRRHLFVEQETYPGAPLDSVRRDFAYLSTLEF
jgi:sugar phosphate isomerase/epimerase